MPVIVYFRVVVFKLFEYYYCFEEEFDYSGDQRKYIDEHVEYKFEVTKMFHTGMDQTLDEFKDTVRDGARKIARAIGITHVVDLDPE